MQMQTFYCSECKNLFDMQVGTREKTWYQPGMDLQCRRCKTGKLIPWNWDDPCPKCGGRIESQGVTMAWD